MGESRHLEMELRRAGEQSRRAGSEAAFRAAVEERLRAIDAQIEELKTRVNGLLFFIAGTVLAQVLLRLLA